MAQFRITFDATPEVGTAPWSGRESARLKMMQSLTDYLLHRCGARNVRVMEVLDSEPAAAEKPKRSAKSSGL